MLTRPARPGRSDQKGQMDDLLVCPRAARAHQVVFAQVLAVIGGEEHDRPLDQLQAGDGIEPVVGE